MLLPPMEERESKKGRPFDVEVDALIGTPRQLFNFSLNFNFK